MKTLPQIMGVLNVTPDSFSDGGRFAGVEAAIRQARVMRDAGADIIDIGGESTRPGAKKVSIADEVARVVPVVAALRLAFSDDDEEPLISVDTRKPEVAREAVLAGADIWNDVSGLTFAEDSVEVAADLGCPLILMHAQGSPETMQENPRYGETVNEIAAWLEERLVACEEAGIERGRVTVDPGIGFGKRLEDNLAILKDTCVFSAMGAGVLVGASRKSFIGKLDGSVVGERLGGSLAAAVLAAQCGASMLRVHDVAETRQALIVTQAVLNANGAEA